MRHGPVDILLVAYGEPHFDGSMVAELRRLAEAGTIRVLDAMFMTKADDGVTMSLDIEDIPGEERASFGFIETGTRGLFDAEDAETIMEAMAPGSAIVALAIEHAWAVGLRDALEATGAELAMDVRIPAAVIDDAYAALASA